MPVIGNVTKYIFGISFEFVHAIAFETIKLKNVENVDYPYIWLERNFSCSTSNC
jgi:hypothetical protein